MITQNFINYMKTMLCSTTNNNSYDITVKAADGTNYYINFSRASTNTFPRIVAQNFLTTRTTLGATGIALGSGTTPATKSDYNIENQITSGLSVAIVPTNGVEQGNPFIEYAMTVSNTSNAAITIAEIAYFQQVASQSTIGSTGTSVHGIMFDRTVLATPVTIAPGDYESISYKLMTSEPS